MPTSGSASSAGDAVQLAGTSDDYGDDLGHQYWVEATLAGAPQPGGPGPDAPPVGQDAPPVLPLAIRQQTRTVGALQPGENPWEGCFFLSETLRHNQRKLRRECPQLRFATTMPFGSVLLSPAQAWCCARHNRDVTVMSPTMLFSLSR